MHDNQSPSRAAAGNDNRPEPVERSFFSDLLMGIRFYSRLPLGNSKHETPYLSFMAPALPFTSLIIGAGPALVLIGGTFAGLPPMLAATLAVGVFAIVTGAMAEDAIADAADGLFGGQTMARRLEIFKDSALGTYGVIALVLYIAARIFALGAIAAISPFAAGFIWMGAGVLARSGALWLPFKLPSARIDGASASVGALSRGPFIAGMIFALLISIVVAAPFTGIVGLLIALVLVASVCVGWTWVCDRLVGGQTGDLIGALQALLEIAALGAFIVGMNI